VTDDADRARWQTSCGYGLGRAPLHQPLRLICRDCANDKIEGLEELVAKLARLALDNKVDRVLVMATAAGLEGYGAVLGEIQKP
jgi:hypothetical protein